MVNKIAIVGLPKNWTVSLVIIWILGGIVLFLSLTACGETAPANPATTTAASTTAASTTAAVTATPVKAFTPGESGTDPKVEYRETRTQEARDTATAQAAKTPAPTPPGFNKATQGLLIPLEKDQKVTFGQNCSSSQYSAFSLVLVQAEFGTAQFAFDGNFINLQLDQPFTKKGCNMNGEMITIAVSQVGKDKITIKVQKDDGNAFYKVENLVK